MENKQNRTWAIVGTVAAILLCGLPGLCLLCPASVWIFYGTFPAVIGNDYYTPKVWGLLPFCLSILFIVIAVLVPVLTLRKKKDATTEPAPVDVQPPLPPQEPLPPAS